ncbi:hypothetical protein HYU08_03940 [Candidatus Woesearchaeota archaeon]|nr:hypothetical protein [Candidatus Woesearchaeota archaeon]
MKEGPSLETAYVREKLHALADVFKYLPALIDNGYLVRRQRGELEGMTENRYRLRPAQNSNPQRTGTYDIATKLGMYNPATSFTAPLYVQPERKRNPYQREENQY